MDTKAQPLRVVHTHELKVCEHNDVIHHVEYDFYSQRLAVISSEKIVSVYTKLPDDTGWTKTGQFKVGGGATWRVKWAHPTYGQVIATASFDGNIYIFQETTKLNSQLNSLYLPLINCEWKQKAHIPSTPPTSINDITFVLPFFGLMIGVCDSRGYVTVYEADDPLSLDRWYPQMKLQVFEYRCKALSFSSDRFNTLLVATCTDDDRCRSHKQLAIFPFVRNCDIDNVPTPDITYLSPSVGLDNVHLPPCDLKFSPTGAYTFQRLAVAVGSYIVIYNIEAVVVENVKRSNSPTLSESSHNSVVMAPSINITNVVDDKNKDIYDEKKDDVSFSAYKSNHKKSVQFNIDINNKSFSLKEPIDEHNASIGKIKPSLKKPKNETIDNFNNQSGSEDIVKMKNMHSKKTYGSESMDAEISASDDIRTLSPIQVFQTFPNSSKSNDLTGNDNYEENADEADSETSDVPMKIKTNMNNHGIVGCSINSKNSHQYSVVQKDAFDSTTEYISNSQINFKKIQETLADNLEIEKKNEIKTKHKKLKKKSYQEDNDKNYVDRYSSSSEDSNKSKLKNKKIIENKEIQKTTTEFRSVGGKFESALIKVETTDRQPFITNDYENGQNKTKIITSRQAVLKAGKSQTKRISFNNSGSLITAIYTDGRVRIWKRITPVLWTCASIIDKPMMKTKENLSITSKKIYY